MWLGLIFAAQKGLVYFDPEVRTRKITRWDGRWNDGVMVFGIAIFIIGIFLR